VLAQGEERNIERFSNWAEKGWDERDVKKKTKEVKNCPMWQKMSGEVNNDYVHTKRVSPFKGTGTL